MLMMIIWLLLWTTQTSSKASVTIVTALYDIGRERV